MSTTPDIDAFESALAARDRTRRRFTVAVIALLSLVAVAGAVVGGGSILRAWLRKRRLRAEAMRVEPPRRTLTGLDALYGEDFPRWMVITQYRGDPAYAGEITRRFDAMRARAEGDAELQARMDRVHGLVLEDLTGNAQAVHDELRGWNAHLDARHQPYHLFTTIQRGTAGVVLVTSVYRTLTDDGVQVGPHRVRARLLARIDHTNIREALLGHVSDATEGALVLTDRSRDFVVRTVWPMLDATGDASRTPAERAWASHVRDEARAGVPSDLYAVLVRTAKAHREVSTAVDAVNARARCGSSFHIVGAEPHGLSARDLLVVLSVAERDVLNAHCPAVTPAEAETLADRSESLAHERDLDRAIDALAASVMRGVVAHEARHAADAVVTGGVGNLIDCPGCPVGVWNAARAELSAYLASFAWSRVPYTSLRQACAATEDGGGSHATAMRIIREQVLRGRCDAPPPDDLVARARAAEQTFFGRSDAIAVPDALTGDPLVRAMAEWR